MKYCRFQRNDQVHYGLVEPVAGHDAITRLLVTPPEKAGGDVESLRTRRIDQIAFCDAQLLPPMQPSKIVCVGRNYREHAAELGHEVPQQPLLFFKPPSALLSPGGTVLRPKISQRVDYEGELGVVMGKTCYQPAAEEDVRTYILGYTCVNDVTARDLQNKDGQWARAKGVDTRVNGAVRQQGNTRDFIFTLDVIIRHIAQVMTLFPGDLIATGTPAGVGPVVAGDVVEVSVEGVGTLRNVIADQQAGDINS